MRHSCRRVPRPRENGAVCRRAATYGEVHVPKLCPFPFEPVQVLAQLDNPLAGKDAENRPLVLGEIWAPVSAQVMVMRSRKTLPAGASRENCSRSSLRNAWTPVKLRWVSRGQQFRSRIMLCSRPVRTKYPRWRGQLQSLPSASDWCNSSDEPSPGSQNWWYIRQGSHSRRRPCEAEADGSRWPGR